MSRPCETLRLDRIKDHEATSSHIVAHEVYVRQAEVLAGRGGDMERALAHQNTVEKAAMKGRYCKFSILDFRFLIFE